MTVFPSNIISERATIRFQRIEKRVIPYDMVNIRSKIVYFEAEEE
jgi:hypothetical protein